MVLHKLWIAKTENEPPLLPAAIDHSHCVFGHDHLKPVLGYDTSLTDKTLSFAGVLSSQHDRMTDSC